MADLPSPQTIRWVIRKKAEVVNAVNRGLLTLDDACKRYRLSVEEFMEWETALRRHNFTGLRTTVRNMNEDLSDREA